MRIFHRLLFNGYLVNTYQYTDAMTADVLGRVDMVHISGYTSQVTGTLPTLSIQMFGSTDGQDWIQYYGAISALALSTSQETLFQARDNDPDVDYRFPSVRLGLLLGGTSPRALVRLWVTGRDQSRRASSLMDFSPRLAGTL